MSNVVAFDQETFRHSDGELPHGASDVWGIAIFGSCKAHHWRISRSHPLLFYESVCGVRAPRKIANGQNSLLGPGTYPKCKRCMGILRKRGSEATGLAR
jgi:hypothetical protein